jgi:hypothetical protein
LCDEAKSILQRVAAEFRIELEEINIEQDPDAFEKYRNDIPVIFLNGRKIFKHRVDENKLRQIMNAMLQ